MNMSVPQPFDAESATEIARPIRVPRGVNTGLIAGTLVEGESGWRPIETLPEGGAVRTLDNGFVRPLRLECRRVQPREQGLVVLLPGGCLDASEDLALLPGQLLVVDTMGDPALEGAGHALVPALAALALDGTRALRPEQAFEVMIPHFAEARVVRAQSGVLLFCAGTEGPEGAGGDAEDGYPCLSLAAARNFLRRRVARLAG